MYDFTDTNIEMPFLKSFSLICAEVDNISYYYNGEKVEVIKWYKLPFGDKIKQFFGIRVFYYVDIKTNKGIEKVKKVDLVQKIKYQPRQFYK